MIVAQYPDTEAPADEEVLQGLIDNGATSLEMASYAISDESFAVLYRLIPMGEHEYPFVLVANDFAFTDTYQVFGSFRTAEGAFAAWVEVLREGHAATCEPIKGKCAHEWIDGQPPKCPVCDRPRTQEPWPVERGKKCSPKTWVECIRPDGS